VSAGPESRRLPHRGWRWLLRRPDSWPVRVRIAVVSAVLTAVILFGFAAVVGRFTSNRLLAEFREELRASAGEAALFVRVKEFDQSSASSGLEQMAAGGNASIRLINNLGEESGVFGAGDGLQFGAPQPGEVRALADGTLAIDAELPTYSGAFAPHTAFVQFARSPAGVEATIDRVWLFLGAGVAIGTLLAGLAGMAVANRAMRPIAALTEAARDIANTRDPSLRIPKPTSEDEVGELAATLEQMLRELDAARADREQTIQRQREFVADASHELRTPLTSILANLELLEAELGDDPATGGSAATASALRSSRRMSRLVADLLLLARADAGRAGSVELCDLGSIVAAAVDEVRPIAAGHELVVSAPAGITVDGNPDELHRMILNLLENAIRHTPAGSTAWVELSADGDVAVLEVRDDGPGLPAGSDDSVFGRFVRGAGPADRNANGEGTGLGLSIVRAVTSSHHGSVAAASREGGGARLTIRIPLAAAEPVAGAEAVEPVQTA